MQEKKEHEEECKEIIAGFEKEILKLKNEQSERIIPNPTISEDNEEEQKYE